MKQKQRKKQVRYQPASKQTNTKKRKRRRRGRNLLYYLMFAFLAVSVGIILSLTVFFKIETIQVEGGTYYQDSAVISSTGVALGDNLFRVDSDEVERALLAEYPYIQEVRVRRRLPNRLVLQLTEAEPLGAFLQDGGYILVSTQGRVLEVSTGPCPEQYLQVSGVPISGAVPCTDLPEEQDESLNMLIYLVEAIEQTGFEQITKIDLSDRLNIFIEYDNRLRIELGIEGDLYDKLDFAKYAIDTNVRDDFEGIMDVTVPKRISILPSEIHEPGYHKEEEVLPELELDTEEEKAEDAAPQEEPENPPSDGAAAPASQ